MAVFAAPAAPFAPDTAALCRVLATPAGCFRLRDVPVDWHDRRAGTWRPTAVAQAASPRRSPARVDVFVPIDDGIAIAPAPVDELRIAHGHSDAVTRFWTIRYRLRLFRTLAATLERDDAAIVEAAIAALAGAEAETRDVWLTAYAHGVPPRHPRTLLRPSEVRIIAGNGSARPPEPRPASPSAGNILVRAVGLYRAELIRLQDALTEAGTPAGLVMRHPLCSTLASLLAAAAAELVRHDPPEASIALDPAVWGP